MERRFRAHLICAAALVLGTTAAADEGAPAVAKATAPTMAAKLIDIGAVSLEVHLSDPTILSPKGFDAEPLPAYDDFLHRAVAQKRVELVRFVDRDDRRVFLGLTRDGYLGIHVQKRDRRR